jgi:actin-related protein
MTTYVHPNFASKAALKRAVAEGKKVRFERKSIVNGGDVAEDFTGKILDLCGPHFPSPHKWYANVEMKDGKILKIT